MNARPTLEEAVQSLNVTRPRPVPGAAYRLNVAAVAGLLVLLPVLYFALIAALGWGVGWYALHGGEILPRLRGMSLLLARFGPVLIGAFLVAFLLKPLVARRGSGRNSRTLAREEEPVLYGFVDRLAELQGAPRPSRIDVNLDVNASAGFDGWSGLAQKKLVLTLGLPLVHGLSARELTGVIAHEFGHFSQGGAMRASFVITTVQSWFRRAVYGRDSWDRALERAGEGTGFFAGRVALLFHAARGAVWLTRKILFGLMRAGELVTSSLSRQMEFNADQHAGRVVGAQEFATAMRALPVIDAADDGAIYDVNVGWRDGRLGDDWIELVEANIRQLPEEQRAEIVRDSLERTPRMYDSHPPTGERIERVRALGEECGVALEGRGSLLLDDVHQLSRELTEDYYRSRLGAGFDPARVVSSSIVAAEGERQLRRERLVETFLGASFRFPVLLPELERVDATGGALDREAYGTELEEAFEVDADVRNRLIGQALLDAELKVERKMFALDTGSALESAEARYSDAAELLARFDRFAGAPLGRIEAALVRLEPSTQDADRERQREDLGHAATVLRALGRVRSYVFDLHRMGDVLERFADVFEAELSERETGPLRHFARQAESVRATLLRLADELGREPYPYEHQLDLNGEGELSIAAFLLRAEKSELASAAPDEILGRTSGVLDRIEGLYDRAVGDAAWACELVEPSAGDSAAAA